MTIMKPTSPTYHRGDVVLVLFPNSNLQTAKRRPALLLQADNLQIGLSQVIVAMISSRTSRGNHPSRVTIPYASVEGIQSGLLTDSVVMTDNLATVLEAGIDSRSLSMETIEIALKHTLGLL